MLPDGAELAAGHFKAATNMTDRAASLAVLAHRMHVFARSKQRAGRFEAAYRNDPLVMDKWFQIQATYRGRRRSTGCGR